MVGDKATHLRRRGTKPGATEDATVDWSGMARQLHQTSVRWSAGAQDQMLTSG